MPLASWLFLKDSQTIWVERPHGTTLIVAGPGKTAQQTNDFRDEAELDRYQMNLAERLARDGWLLWGVNKDRRDPQTGQRRRTGTSTERRASR